MSFNTLYNDVEQRSMAKRQADRNYMEELRKQQEDIQNRKMNDRRKDVQEAQRILFGKTVQEGQINNNFKPSTQQNDSRYNKTPLINSSAFQQNQQFKQITSPEDKLESDIINININTITSKLNHIEAKVLQDLIQPLNMTMERTNQLDNRVNSTERQTVLLGDEMRSRVTQLSQELGGKISQLDRSRAEDHQKLLLISDDTNKLKEFASHVNNRTNELISKSERLTKDLTITTTRQHENSQNIKDHDLQLSKMSAHITQEFDGMVKRMSAVHGELNEKINMESKSRAGLDLKYDQWLKELRAMMGRQVDEFGTKLEASKVTTQDSIQRCRNEAQSIQQELKASIANVDKDVKDVTHFVKDSILRQLAQQAETLKVQREEQLKLVNENQSTFNSQMLMLKGEIGGQFQTKDQQFESHKETTLQLMRQLQDKQRQTEIDVSHKLVYLEEMVRDETNSRSIIESQTHRQIQDNRSLLVQSVDDMDVKIKNLVSDVQQTLDKHQSRHQAEWVAKYNAERKKIDDIQSQMSVDRQKLKERCEGLESRLNTNWMMIERIDQESKSSSLTLDCRIKDQKISLDATISALVSKLDETQSDLHAHKVDSQQRLDQKFIVVDSQLQVHLEEINKRMEKTDMERVESNWNNRFDESIKSFEQQKRIIEEQVDSKLKLTEDGIHRRLHEVDTQESLLRDALDIQQGTFQTFHQSVNSALSKIQNEMLQRPTKDDFESQMTGLTNQFYAMQSDLRALSKQFDLMQRRITGMRDNKFVNGIQTVTEPKTIGMDKLQRVELKPEINRQQWTTDANEDEAADVPAITEDHQARSGSIDKTDFINTEQQEEEPINNRSRTSNEKHSPPQVASPKNVRSEVQSQQNTRNEVVSPVLSPAAQKSKNASRIDNTEASPEQMASPVAQRSKAASRNDNFEKSPEQIASPVAQRSKAASRNDNFEKSSQSPQQTVSPVVSPARSKAASPLGQVEQTSSSAPVENQNEQQDLLNANSNENEQENPQ